MKLYAISSLVFLPAFATPLFVNSANDDPNDDRVKIFRNHASIEGASISCEVETHPRETKLTVFCEASSHTAHKVGTAVQFDALNIEGNKIWSSKVYKIPKVWRDNDEAEMSNETKVPDVIFKKIANVEIHILDRSFLENRIDDDKKIDEKSIEKDNKGGWSDRASITIENGEVIGNNRIHMTSTAELSSNGDLDIMCEALYGWNYQGSEILGFTQVHGFNSNQDEIWSSKVYEIPTEKDSMRSLTVYETRVPKDIVKKLDNIKVSIFEK